jgi:hypothetical protein
MHTSSRGFLNALGFSAAKFQPILLGSLFIEMAQRVFVEGYPLDSTVLADLLSFNNYACRHTNVFFIMPTKLTELRWAHMSLRPWGHHIPTQCVCGAVWSWGKPTQTSDSKAVKLTCNSKGCKHRLTFQPPTDNINWAASAVRGGRWMLIDYEMQA